MSENNVKSDQAEFLSWAFSIFVCVVLFIAVIGLLGMLTEPERTGKGIGKFFGSITKTYNDAVGTH